MPKRLQAALPLCVLAALSWSAGAQPGQPGDSFYRDLLAEGEEAFVRGDYAVAADRLEVACFGLLDTTTQLATGLVHLALARAELGDRDGFLAEFERIVDIEQRFGAYAKAELPAELRQLFEDRLPDLVAAPRLQELPAFRHTLDQRRLREIEALPAKQQRARLEALARSQPSDPRWPFLLARIELDGDREKAAMQWLDEALTRDPTHEEARCARRDLLASRNRCGEALADSRACRRRPAGTASAQHLLACFVELAAWSEAHQLLGALEPAEAADPRIQELAGRLPTP